MLVALALPLLVLGLYVGAPDLPVLREFEAQTLDWRYRLRGPLTPADAVALVVIDDRTLAELGRWPLSRRHLGDAARAVTADGARVVAFDLLFPEAEAGLPEEVATVLSAVRSRLGGEAPELIERVDRLLERRRPDDRFAAALRDAGSVVLPFAFVFHPGQANVRGVPPAIAEAAFRVHRRPAGVGIEPPVHPAGILAPTPPLAAAATPAHVTVLLEPDGSLRHDQAAVGFGDDYFPSLPIEVVRLYDGVAREDVVLRLGEGIALGDRFVPTDRRMRLTINHYGPPGTFDTHSLADVVRNRVPAGSFAGRIVLIGASARGVGDTFPTPFSRMLPGVEHYATAIDNILTDRALVGHGRTAPADVLAILVGGLAAALLGRLLPPLAAAAGVAVLVVGWFAGAAALFATDHLWLTVTHPAAAAALGFGVFATARILRDQRARRRAERQRGNLMRYFSPGVAERLMDSNRPGLGDRTQPVAILFVDLVGFTALSERLAPAEAMALLRRFYSLVEQAVFERDGCLDKFLGDGALALFGIPEPSADDARNALLAARAIADRVAEWRRDAPAGEPVLAVGIGVHCGPVLVGDAGGDRQFSFTVTGDAVNTASRLESLTRDLDVTIVVSDAVLEAARATGGQAAVAGFSPLPLQHLRGRERPIGVWGWPETQAPAGRDGEIGAERVGK